MMFAEAVAKDVNWTLIVSGLMALATVGMWLDAKKKRVTEIKQPVNVTISEELHKIFAAKEVFEKHVAENREDHDKIFSKMGGVERGAASALEAKVEVVRKDLIHIGNQVAGLKTQTDLQNQQLARMDSKLDRLAEK